MRILIIVVAGLAACARSGGSADTASGRDSVVVAGPPAVPTTLVPAETLASSGAPAASPSPTPSVDSIRGTVSVTGTSFEKHVMLAERGTRRRVEVTGPLATLIGRVAGTEITAVGQRSGTRLEASRFAVRVVDGQPAIDGTLRSENGNLFIVTTDGARTRIVAPPPPFAGREGARVWITGDPARSVASFGFIDPPR